MVPIQTFSLRRLLTDICVAVSVTVISVSGLNELYLTKVGSVSIGGFDKGAAEISAYDPETQQVFVTNAENNTVDIISISDPENPTKTTSIDCSPYGGGVNSVAVRNGLVAVASEADVKQNPGSIVFFNTDGEYLATAPAGALPDMVTFTHDGKRVLSANEGEPNDAYTDDPEGSITIVDLSNGLSTMKTQQVDFRSYNRYKKNLIRSGVRIFGPGATVAQDLEPEYITVGPYGLFAYVTLQENNAIAIVNILRAKCVWIVPLGLKDHSLPENGFDASNKDKAIAIKNWPVSGMYLPDAIASYKFYGLPLLVTANEGDSRDYDGYSEEERVKDIILDPAVFPDASELMEKENLGRLKISTALSRTNEKGEYKKIFSYGGRSFSIFTPLGQLLYDSGDDFEQITASIYRDNFNSTNDENGSFDNRSDDKGPEPEALTIGKIGKKTFAFIGMERIGGIMVYDITNPYRVEFVTYVNNRNFDAEADTPEAGDLGVEGLVFVGSGESPTKKPLLVASNEVSGTVTLFEIHIRDYPKTSFTKPVPFMEDSGVTVFNGGYGSSLAPHPTAAGYFYLMTDRGPNVNAPKENDQNVKVFPYPKFVPQIGLFRLDGNELVKTVVITLKDEEGKAVSGLPNPEGFGATGEIAKDLTGKNLGEDKHGLDPEGLAIDKDGTFWISDEYGPHIVHFDASGKTIERINPYGTGYGGRRIPAVFKTRRANRGMEGLTLTPGGKVVGIMQSSMYNPDSSVRQTAKATRILVFNPYDGSTKQYLYIQEAPGLSNSEITALSETEFVVLEGDGSFPGNGAKHKRFYKIDISDATDVSDPVDGENGLLIYGKTLEQCTDEDLSDADIVPVKKSLIIELLDQPVKYPHDKPEGFTLLNDNRILAVVNDDDFGILGNGMGGIIPKVLPITGEIDRNSLYFFKLR